MLQARIFRNFNDPVWSKVTTLGSTLFFVFLADAILSYWIPNYMQEVLGSAFLMGLFMSFSSIVGITVDMYLPQIIKGITVKRLLTVGIGTGMLFSVLLLLSTWVPLALVFLLAMALWGIYYEFFGFAEQQFVADSIALKLHSSVWAILDMFKNLAYFLGPILAGYLLLGGNRVPILIAIIFSGIGFSILLTFGKKHSRPVEIDTEQVSFSKELEHWKALFDRVWPMIILSLLMGMVDATYWTTGTVLTQKLAKQSIIGSMFLPAYMLPTLFVWIIMAKKKIFEGKKKLAELSFLISSLILFTLSFTRSIVLIIAIVFVSSIFLSLAYPLVNGVYSDVVARMGRERRHLIGLTRSSISLSYIIGPVLAGALASKIGEVNTFSVVGAIGGVTALLLLITTPKKLKLPQDEIRKWEG